jgi:hypothetical protein
VRFDPLAIMGLITIIEKVLNLGQALTINMWDFTIGIGFSIKPQKEHPPHPLMTVRLSSPECRIAHIQYKYFFSTLTIYPISLASIVYTDYMNYRTCPFLDHLVVRPDV